MQPLSQTLRLLLMRLMILWFDYVSWHFHATINYHSTIQVFHLSLSFAFACGHSCGRLLTGWPVCEPVHPFCFAVERWALLTLRLLFCTISSDLQAICLHRFYASCSIILIQLFMYMCKCVFSEFYAVLFGLLVKHTIVLSHISRLSSSIFALIFYMIIEVFSFLIFIFWFYLLLLFVCSKYLPFDCHKRTRFSAA